MKKSVKPGRRFAGGPAESALTAGASAVDITPPLEVGLLMSSVEERWAPFESVRLPLKARVLALAAGKEMVVLIALDLLALNATAAGGWARFKRSISRGLAQIVPPGRIVIACTHTHNAPESSAVTDLYKTRPFQKWLGELRLKLVAAINEAMATAQPGTLALAEGELKGFSLQRRIHTASGIVMSDSVQPIAPELFRLGPVDHRVRSLVLRGRDGATVATMIHAICHPVHEMCEPRISADFPGELCAALEGSGTNGLPLFFNGAAGDINPPTVSGGKDTARRHGQALAKTVTAAYAKSIETVPMIFRRRSLKLPLRTKKGLPARRTYPGEISGLRLGTTALLFLPGEIFVETALAIERASPFEQTLVIGFAENSIGYVPTKRAFAEGGYEIGPGKWSFLQAGAEAIIRANANELLRELLDADADDNGMFAAANLNGGHRREVVRAS